MATSTSMQFGELTLAFTTKMSLQWSSQKSGGDYQASFYKPNPPDGFYALGHVANEGYENDGNIAALCVKGSFEAGPNGEQPSLAYPEDYKQVWQDKGTDGKYGGACWRPIAPDGYVALGHLFGKDHDTKPGRKDVVCVRKDLGYRADYKNEPIYGTAGTDANHRFHAYTIIVPRDAVPNDTQMLIAALTFFGKEGGGEPSGDAALWVLNLPIPYDTSQSPEMPTLTSTSAPSEYTTEMVDRVAYAPFTGVKDNDPVDSTGKEISVGWQVEHSPFYAVKRMATYHNVLYYYNQMDTTQAAPATTHTVGVNTDRSDTYSIETGIEVGVQEGVSLEVSETTVSATLSLALGFSTTVSVGEFKEASVTFSLDVPPKTAGALYVPNYTLRLFRKAGEGDEVGNGLPFDANADYVSSQYPSASSASSTISASSAETVSV